MSDISNFDGANRRQSSLVDRAESGLREPGLLNGLIVTDVLFDPLPEDEVASWECDACATR